MAERLGPRFTLLHSLGRVAKAHPLSRKVLISTTFGEGSELLRALALHEHGWAGFEVTTPGRLAAQIAGPDLAAVGLTILDEFGQRALVDQAMDGVFATGEWPDLIILEHGVGFREAILGVVSALRLSGVGPESLASGPARRAFLGELLTSYQRTLAERHLADPAEVLRRAAEVLTQDGSSGPDDTIFLLLPGLGTRGGGGRFIDALQQRGATVLATDPVVGLPPPTAMVWKAVPARGRLSFVHAVDRAPAGDDVPDVEMFAAASVRDELREVLRRMMVSGLRWDDVEIVTVDPGTYGAVLDALSHQLGVPCSFGVGLAIRRTRPGRAMEAYLRWIESGFPAEVLRGLLEAGDLVAPAEYEGVSSAALARLLRRLRVGWGRSRYLPAVRAALELAVEEAAGQKVKPFRDESPEEAQARGEHRVRELKALESLLGILEDATPWTPRPLVLERGSVSAAELARGVQAFLQLVPEGEGANAVGREDLLGRLSRIAETLTRKTSFDAAMAALRSHLDIRVRAAWDEGSPPWKSTGGHVHLTDLSHGGYTGRRATFIVGLDAGRFPGAGAQDPVLLDLDRKELAAGLPTSAERLAERRFQLAALLARTRGRVTASYTAWDSAEARVVQPASVLLDIFRLWKGRPEATFDDFHKALGEPVCAIPRSGPLDGTDVWLDTLGRDGVFLHAGGALAKAFPELGRGMEARSRHVKDQASAHHGLVAPRAELMDPRAYPLIVASATRLEALGACPLRYLLRYGIGLRPPDDPALDPERWLDHLQRGALLHRVFERTLTRAREESLEPGEPAFHDMAIEVLEQEARRLRSAVPVPNEAIYAQGLTLLREDVRSFTDFVRDRGAPWIRLEMKFGRGDSPPVEITVGGGSISVQGAVDRVDRDEDGLHILDYKTGSPYRFTPASAVFHGGRRMQHVTYAEVAEQLLGEDVADIAYVFPTATGRNEERRFTRESVRPGLELLGVMLDQVASGRLLPTNDKEDCRVCDFRSVCRVSGDGWNLSSPMAEWGERNMLVLEEYTGLRRIRGWEDGT